MFNDTIVEEIRKYRSKHAEKFNFDAKLIAEDLRKINIAEIKNNLNKKQKRNPVLRKGKKVA